MAHLEFSKEITALSGKLASNRLDKLKLFFLVDRCRLL